MEKQRVEEPFARQLQEIIAVPGRPSVELQAYIARRRMEYDHSWPRHDRRFPPQAVDSKAAAKTAPASTVRICRCLGIVYFRFSAALSIAPTSIRSRRTR